MREQIISRLIDLISTGEINEGNWSLCGNRWRYLNDLLDQPGEVFGTFAAWTVVAGCEFAHVDEAISRDPESTIDTSAFEFFGRNGDAEEELRGIAARWLNMSASEFEQFASKSHLEVLKTLKALLPRRNRTFGRVCYESFRGVGSLLSGRLLQGIVSVAAFVLANV